MKSKNLQYPFPWAERRTLLEDGILYVPDFYQDYQTFLFPGWQSIFGNTNSVSIEYCSGNGIWITERAAAAPDRNWVAVEMKFDRVRKIWSKAKNYNLQNLFIVCGEALTATHHYFPSGSISEVYVNFPDPWPKKRHAKNRLLQGAFIAEVWRVLGSNGSLALVTDDAPYSELAISEFLAHGSFQSQFPGPYYSSVPEGYGTSYFDDLWRGLGRDIRYHRFHKKSNV